MRGPLGVLVPLVCLATSARANVACQLDYFRDTEAKYCPGERELREAVRSRLGYDPFVDWSPRRVVVDVTVDASGQLRAANRLVEGSGLVSLRSLITATGDDCVELIASVALAISITLDPVRVAGLEPTLEPTANDEPAPAAVDPRPLSPKQEPLPSSTPPPLPVPRQSPTPFGLNAHGGSQIAFGLLPRYTAGLAVGLSLVRDDYGALIEVRAVAPRTQLSEFGAAEVGWLGGTMAACATRGWFVGCAELLMGSLASTGEVVRSQGTQHSLYAAAGPRLHARTQLDGRTRLSFGIELLKTLTPTALRLEQREVWTTPGYSATVGLEVDVRVW